MSKRGPAPRGPGQKVWTAEQVELLRKLWIDGLSATEISAKMPEFSRCAVLGKVHREGIWRPKETEAATRRRSQQAVNARKRVARKAESEAQRQARLAKLVAIPPTPRRTKPKLVLAGNGAVMRVPEAPPPVAGTKAAAFAPLPGSAPRIWTERTFGDCSWPVGGEGADTLACCEPVHAYGWCRAHVEMGRVPLKPEQKRLERQAKRYA